MMVVSADGPERSQQVIDRNDLKFTFLSDRERAVIRDYGVLHAGGGPSGEDIALPAQFLIDRDGRILWRRVAGRIQDRPGPKEVLGVLREKLTK